MVSVAFTDGTCHSSQMSHGFQYIAIYLSHVTGKTAHITSGTPISFYKERAMKLFIVAIRNFV